MRRLRSLARGEPPFGSQERPHLDQESELRKCCRDRDTNGLTGCDERAEDVWSLRAGLILLVIERAQQRAAARIG